MTDLKPVMGKVKGIPTLTSRRSKLLLSIFGFLFFIPDWEEETAGNLIWDLIIACKSMIDFIITNHEQDDH